MESVSGMADWSQSCTGSQTKGSGEWLDGRDTSGDLDDCGFTTGGVLVRPFKLPEATWAVLGAVLLLAFKLLPWSDGLKAVGKGTDVYLFLVGMMLLSEVARREGLFDWVAVFAVNLAKGSQSRLFLLIYGIGVVVTTFLSNDAAAVVLTPAVIAAARKANAKPLPYLFVCAFIANAASFVLPISNPANLVLYGDHMPPLSAWFASGRADRKCDDSPGQAASGRDRHFIDRRGYWPEPLDHRLARNHSLAHRTAQGW